MRKIFRLRYFIALCLIISLAGCSTGNPNIVNTATKTKKESSTKKKKIASIGDELKVGKVIFKVNKVSTTNVIKDNSFLEYRPDSNDAIFYLVNITVKNVGNEAITTDSSFFSLKKNGKEYSPSTIFVTNSKFFYYDRINPGLSQTGNVLFEVPKGEKGFRLNVQTGIFGTEQGEINLK